VPSEKNKEIISGDLDVNDFEIIKKDIDDFNMNIEEEDQSIFKEKDEITKDTNSLKNAKAFLEWYENGADLNSAPADVIKYAHSLVNKHADTSEEEFNRKPEVKKNFEAAKKLSDYSKSKNDKELQNISLEISDLSDGMLNEMKKELTSEIKIEISIEDNYLNDEKDYSLDNKNIKIIEKHEEKIKTEEEKLKKEENLKKISPFDKGIKSFMSLRLEQSESLYLVLNPKVELKEFQKMILEAKNYFSNISEYKPITEIQRNAALSIAADWNILKAESQLANEKSEEFGIFGQFGKIFSKDRLSELQDFPGYPELNELLNEEKIFNDFK
jgi:transposase-like protein